MSAANEYPIGGDLTDDRVSGLLHSTLERLARRTAKNDTHITNIHEGVSPEGIDFKTNFSSPGIVSWAKDPNNTGEGQVARYNYGCSWCCASGFFWFEAEIDPPVKALTFERYIYCQGMSIEIHNSIKAVFQQAEDEGLPLASKVKGYITFQLPKNFKGFKPEGVVLDFRSRATGMGALGASKIILTATIYKSHCTNLLGTLSTKTLEYIQNTAPEGATPEGSGIADSIQHDSFVFTAQDLGALWKPDDTVRIDIELSHNVAAGITSLELHTGVLKINYK